MKHFAQWLFLLKGCLVSSIERNANNLVWEDNFDSLEKWNVIESLAGEGRREMQYYTTDHKAVCVRNGMLTIRQGPFPVLFEDPDEGVAVLNGDAQCEFNIESKGCDTKDYLNRIYHGCRKRVSTGFGDGDLPGGDYLNPVYSGKVTTKRKFSFLYGRVEARIKMPKGIWLLPRFSLVPENNTYGFWLKNGFIDVCLSRGNERTYKVNDKPGGRNTVLSWLRYSTDDDTLNALPYNASYTLSSSDFTESFHVFGVVWAPTYIYTYFRNAQDDEVQLLRVPLGKDERLWKHLANIDQATEDPWASAGNNAPFDQLMHLSVQVGVGGTCQRGRLYIWGNDACWSGKLYPNKKFWEERSKWEADWAKPGAATMEVDWIRVWQDRSKASSQHPMGLIWTPEPGGERKSPGFWIIGVFLSLVILLLGILGYVGSRIVLRNSIKKALKLPSVALHGLTPNSYDQPLWACGETMEEELGLVRIPMEEIHFEQVVSHGGFGVVWRATYGDTYVAVKQMTAPHSDVENVNMFVAEIKLISQLLHPNIVLFVGAAWTTCSDLSAVTEFIHGGDLRDILHDTNVELSWENEKTNIAIDIAEALEYLHSLKPIVIHRDLKSKNVLVTVEMRARLSDFGLSRTQMSPLESMTVGIGTLLWTAPEVFRGDQYTIQADIFSYGVILGELDSRTLPYQMERHTSPKQSDLAIAHGVAAGKLRLKPTYDVPCGVRSLMLRCTALNPEQRPDAKEILRILRATQEVLAPKKGAGASFIDDKRTKEQL